MVQKFNKFFKNTWDVNLPHIPFPVINKTTAWKATPYPKYPLRLVKSLSQKTMLSKQKSTNNYKVPVRVVKSFSQKVILESQFRNVALDYQHDQPRRFELSSSRECIGQNVLKLRMKQRSAPQMYYYIFDDDDVDDVDASKAKTAPVKGYNTHKILKSSTSDQYKSNEYTRAHQMENALPKIPFGQQSNLTASGIGFLKPNNPDILDNPSITIEAVNTPEMINTLPELETKSNMRSHHVSKGRGTRNYDGIFSKYGFVMADGELIPYAQNQAEIEKLPYLRKTQEETHFETTHPIHQPKVSWNDASLVSQKRLSLLPSSLTSNPQILNEVKDENNYYDTQIRRRKAKMKMVPEMSRPLENSRRAKNTDSLKQPILMHSSDYDAGVMPESYKRLVSNIVVQKETLVKKHTRESVDETLIIDLKGTGLHKECFQVLNLSLE
jgi:hypothetical protein